MSTLFTPSTPPIVRAPLQKRPLSAAILRTPRTNSRMSMIGGKIEKTLSNTSSEEENAARTAVKVGMWSYFYLNVIASFLSKQ